MAMTAEHDARVREVKVAQFLHWEFDSRDTIDVKRKYVDITGDLVAGVLLSQLVYWYLPSKSGGRPRVQDTPEGVLYDGKWWLVKKREDWWDECRITPKQFDRVSEILEQKGYIQTQKLLFHGLRRMHIYVDLANIWDAMGIILDPGSST